MITILMQEKASGMMDQMSNAAQSAKESCQGVRNFYSYFLVKNFYIN